VTIALVLVIKKTRETTLKSVSKEYLVFLTFFTRRATGANST